MLIYQNNKINHEPIIRVYSDKWVLIERDGVQYVEILLQPGEEANIIETDVPIRSVVE